MERPKPYEFSERDVARFWSKVGPPTGEKGCRLWTKATNGKDDPYGMFYVGSGSRGTSIGFLAHRVAYLFSRGSIVDELLVCHSCDVRLCCEGSHLFQGTYQSNTDDMVAKGRHGYGEPKSGEESWFHLHPNRGESHPQHILTADQAREILRRYQEGGITQMALAKEFGVGRGAISGIVYGRNWRCLFE